ncbi:alginate export family protein [Sphingomonas sp. 28-63-12]|uniref:alginate export family protein n=1 Tax=Sphingomonas sp. 28-63-12 TaxID=1970434 RepID=UPI0035A8E214
MRRWVLISAIAAASCANAASAKDGALTVDLSVRARIEAIDGQFRPLIPASDAALLLKTDLAIDYDAGPLILGGEIIDSRSYFQRSRSSISTTEVNALEPVQAYIKTDFGGRFQAQFGRFTLNLGGRRLVARSVYRNTTNAFTGARFDLRSRGGDSATLFWTLPQTRLPEDRDGLGHAVVQLDRERTGLQFFGGIVTSRPFNGTVIEAYLYRLTEHDAPGILTRDRQLWVPGTRIVHKPAAGRADFEVEAIWQGGTTHASTAASDITALPVSAWAVHGQIGETFTAAWKPRLALAVDYGSGDRPGGHYTRFDTLFGARVFEFGPTSLYGAVSRQNLASIEALAEVTPDKSWDGRLAVRPLWLADARDSFAATGVRDPAGGAGRYAGTQIDLRARYWLLPKRARLSAGYTHLFKGGFLTNAANAPATGDTNYGFMEMTLTL